MKPGDKIFVEVVINEVIETHWGIYYKCHVDQFKPVPGINEKGFSGCYDSSIDIKVIEGLNKIK